MIIIVLLRRISVIYVLLTFDHTNNRGDCNETSRKSDLAEGVGSAGLGSSHRFHASALLGHRTVEVRESTLEIDRLVRQVAIWVRRNTASKLHQDCVA